MPILLWQKKSVLPVQPYGPNPYVPGAHWSHLRPITLGLQWHWPPTLSHSALSEPWGSHWHAAEIKSSNYYQAIHKNLNNSMRLIWIKKNWCVVMWLLFWQDIVKGSSALPSLLCDSPRAPLYMIAEMLQMSVVHRSASAGIGTVMKESKHMYNSISWRRCSSGASSPWKPGSSSYLGISTSCGERERVSICHYYINRSLNNYVIAPAGGSACFNCG